MEAPDSRDAPPLAELVEPFLSKVLGTLLGLNPAGLALFALGGWGVYLWQRHPEDWWRDPALGAGSAVLGLAALAAITWAVRGWDLRLRVFADGFERRHRGTVRFVPFSDVVHLWSLVSEQDPGLGLTQHYQLETFDGERIAVEHPDRRGMQELGPALVGAYVAAKLPGALAAIERGETLEFGAIQVASRGLSLAEHPFAWEQVRAITQRVPATDWRPYMTVEVTSNPDPFWSRLDGVPDAMLLMQLVRRLAGLRPGS